MGVLQRFEQRLEHLVTGAFARTFRSAVQPVEVAAALQREVDNAAQILSRDRRLAPNDFAVDLSPADYERLSAFGQTLSNELAGMLHQHAQEQGYMFAGPLALTFRQADDLTTGRFRVRSSASAQVTATRPPQPRPGATAAFASTSTAPSTSCARPGWSSGGAPAAWTCGSTTQGSRGGMRIRPPGRTDGHPAVSGWSDLGSTNGTAVNGQRLQHAVLKPGDVIQVGGTRIRVFRGVRCARGRRATGAGPVSDV